MTRALPRTALWWAGLAVTSLALIALPFALSMAGTAWVRITNLAILFGSNYQDVFAFVVLILVLVFRPSGLLGERVGDRA